MIEKRKVHRHIGRWLIPGLVLLLTVTLIGYWYMKERPSNERIEYFNGSNPIIFHGKQEGNAYIDGDQVYLPIDWFHQHLCRQRFTIGHFNDKNKSDKNTYWQKNLL